MALAVLASNQGSKKPVRRYYSTLLINYLHIYLQVGACVVLEEPRRVLSVGYNGPPDRHRDKNLSRMCVCMIS